MKATLFTVPVLVPAAGSGSRMGGTPKQDRMLGDAPLLVQTLRSLAASNVVGRLIVAVDPDRVAEYEEKLNQAGLRVPVRVVAGGDSRQASVAAMLSTFHVEDDSVVLVHDAARPFVSLGLILRVVASAVGHDAVSPAIAVADTLRRGEGDAFGATVDRDDLYRIQTPQGFYLDVLRTAHAQADPYLPATDDAGLAERAGYEVARVDGSIFNFKITTPDDWTFAQALWSLWSTGALQTT